MAVANLLSGIEYYTDELRKVRKDKAKYSNEKEVYWLEERRYKAYYQQIHDYLAPKGTQQAEKEIREHIRTIITLDLEICRSKRDRCFNAIAVYEKRKDTKNQMLCFEYFQKWRDLYERYMELVAYRSLEHFALLWENNFPMTSKVFANSIDPHGDGGYTGVNKPFLHYFNRMVLKKDIRFITKQYPTGFGKCALPSTLVRTPNGITTLENIEVGDFVYSMQDNELSVQKVTNKWYTHKKQVKITTRGGAEITVSPEHRLYTQKGYIKAKDMTCDDYLYRLCKPIEQGIEQDQLELEFATLMLFEGTCFTYRLSFTQEDNEILKKFIDICEKLQFKYRVSQQKDNKAKEVHIWHNEGRPDKILAKYGILNCLAKNKVLSNLFLDLPIKQRFDFISIMLSTDGFIPISGKTRGGNLAGVTLASEELIKGIQKLLNSCGIYSYFSQRKVKFDKKEFNAYVLQIPDEYFSIIAENCYCYHKQYRVEKRMEMISKRSMKPYCNNTNYPKEVVENCKEFKKLVNKQFKRNKTFKREIVEKFANETGLLQNVVYKDFVWEQIKSIEFIDEETDMIDIEVENTHNFIANDLVSHNSISDAVAIAWLLGVNPDNDVLKVLGNPTLVMTTTKAIVDIMTKPFFGRVFPKFAKYFAQGENPLNMFSICRNKEGELTLADSSKPMNVKVISKDTSVDGIRVRFLFLDDICRSKDATNLKQHQIDINNYWNSWWKRNYGTDDFFVVAGGTAYSVNDILSHLISYYSKGKIIRTKQFKYAYTNEKGDCVFIKIPKIDFDFNRSTYPSKFPYEEAMRIRDRDLASFEAMEQQNPQNPETTPLAWDKLNTYEELPSGISEYAYAVIDPARTGKNYVTMGIHRVREETDKYGAKVEVHYLVDCIFQLRQMEELYGEICDKVEKHKIIKLHIENNTDTSLGFLIEKMLHERGTMFCEVSESFSTENKEEKIRELVYSSQGYFKNQMRYPCMQMYAPSSQMGKFMLYITAYDYNTKMEYDDSIDEECMYIKKFVKKVETTVKPQILWV